MVAGIDYGSKFSGNTVVAIASEDRQVQFHSTRKGKDAIKFHSGKAVA